VTVAGRLLGGLVAVAVAAAGAPVHADERITDDTPYVIPEGARRVGLWKLQYGIQGVRGLEVGTYILPYASWAFDVGSVNAHVKYQFLRSDRWALAASLGLAYVDLGGIGVEAQMFVVPVQLLAARHLGRRFTLGAGLMYTQITGTAQYNEDEASELRGAVAIDNAQSWLFLMFQVSRGWSLYLESRGISSTEAAASGTAKHAIDDRTSIDVELTGKASIDEMQGASTLLAAQYSGRRFRLRLGVGYGNFNLPVINFIVPVATVFPEFDLYWVF